MHGSADRDRQRQAIAFGHDIASERRQGVLGAFGPPGQQRQSLLFRQELNLV